ncbi:hypothetical protein LB505_013819 [Fusarium chuoi]|nr:hypothetical protein LB505_013819 [Fusarium chuoi]
MDRLSHPVSDFSRGTLLAALSLSSWRSYTRRMVLLYELVRKRYQSVTGDTCAPSTSIPRG